METTPHLSPLKVITSRHPLLEQIDNGVQNKRDLHDNLNISRTTIDRAVRELEAENILRRRGGCCEFTRFGRLAYQQFCNASQTFKTLSNASELLSILPNESALGISLLDSADVKLADQRAPSAPFKHFAPISNSEQIQAMIPILLPQQLDFLCQRAEDDNTVELLIHDDLTQIIEEEYADEFEMLNKYSVQISTSASLPQFGLTIIDSQTVWISVHRASGGLHGLLRNSNTKAVDQAQQLFEQYLKDSSKYKKVQA